MARYRLTLAYEGGGFCGWQKQEPRAPVDGRGVPEALIDPDLEPGEPGRVALRTVQAVVERAVREVVREPVVLMGASRTDAGVHARGQVSAFSCSEGAQRGRGWPPERGLEPMLRAINARLPEDVLAVRVERAPDDFDPISHAKRKGYSYTFYESACRPLWERRHVLHMWHALDVEAMDRAARLIEGTHDFESFAAAGHGRTSTVRTVFRCRVLDVSAPLTERRGAPAIDDGEQGAAVAEAHAESASIPDGRTVRLEIEGDGFLYNMVRIIAGTLVDVGRRKAEAEGIPGILAARDRRRAGQTLPPDGLCLEWVEY